MLPVLVAILAAADQPPVAVMIASKRAGADAFATKIAAKVHSSVVATVPGALDDAAASKTAKNVKACQGATECLQKAAQQLGPKAVVIGVDVGKIAKTLAVHLEAVAADGTEPLAVADFSAPADSWTDASAEPISAFVKQVTDKLTAPAPVAAKPDEIKRPQDAPQDTQLTPPPEPAPAPVVTASRSSGSSKLVPIILVAGAGAVLVTSLVFMFLGNGEKSAVERSINGMNTELTQAEFNRRRSTGNLYFTISFSTALAGLLLGAAGGVLFAL